MHQFDETRVQRYNLKKIKRGNYKMILYHGSKSGIKGDIVPNKSRETCDFGYGFYMEELPDQPKGLIATRENGRYYEIDYDMSNLTIKNFSDTYIDQVDWALFICHNRRPELFENYTTLKNRYDVYNKVYDVIIGLIADDSMMNTLNKFFAGQSSDKVLIDCLKYVKLGKQYVLKTKKACDKNRIKFLVDRPLNHKEKKLACAEIAKRSKYMDSVIDMFERKYRRDAEAKFLDEIMEAWNI